MVVWSSTFVVAEEEDRVVPGRAVHERIHHTRHLNLPIQNRLTRPWMLVIVAVTGLNECKAGQRAVGQIGEVGGYPVNVARVDAKGVPRIVNYFGPHGGCLAGSARWIVVQILIRIGQVREVCRGIRCVRAGLAVILVEAKALADRVVDFPRYTCLVKCLEDIRYFELRKPVIAAGVLYQTLGRASREGGDAI